MMEYVVTCISLLANLIIGIVCYKTITKDTIFISKYKILLLIVFSLMSCVTRIITNNGFIMLVTNMFLIHNLIKCFFENSTYKSFYYTIVIIIVNLFTDALVSLFISNQYFFDLSLFQKNYYLRSLMLIPVLLLNVVICSIGRFKKAINSFYDKFFSKARLNKFRIILLLVCVIVISVLFGINSYNEVNRINHTLIVIGISAFILLLIFTIYVMYKEYQIEQINERIIDENNYIKKIAMQDQEFKHNVINNLLGIKTVSNKKTNALIDELINSYQTEYKTITNINDLPSGVQSIIYKKAYEENIDDLKLVVDNSIKNELYDLLNAKQYNNLCTAIGILFDNALQAVKETNEKIIFIEFTEDDKNVNIIFKNSFSNIIDLDITGKKNHTTKKEGHGIGLKYLHKLKTLNFNTEIFNNMFVSKISVKKVKKI